MKSRTGKENDQEKCALKVLHSEPAGLAGGSREGGPSCSKYVERVTAGEDGREAAWDPTLCG